MTERTPRRSAPRDEPDEARPATRPRPAARRASGAAGAAAARDADDELNNRLFFRMFQAMNVYERVGQREVGVSGVQGAVMGALSVEPERGVAFSELVEHLAVSRQNLDGVLKRLEKLGWVERVAPPDDGRIRMVRLKPAGRAAWDRIIERSLRFFRAAVRGVPRAEREAFVGTLIRIGRGLKAIEPGEVADADAPAPRGAGGRAATRAAAGPPRTRAAPATRTKRS